MSGTKVTSLTEKTTPIVDQDMIYVADYNGGSYASRKYNANKLILPFYNFITDAGFTYDQADYYQFEKAMIAKSFPIGHMLDSEIELTPVIYSAARSTTNPSYPEYLPVIKRYDADHDVTTAQAPLLVAAYRAQTAKINVAGSITSSWTGTVSGSTITFASNAANLALLNMINEEALANGFIQTQAATFSALFTGTAQRCINVNGTDYAITGCNPAGPTLTVSGTPTTGSQTCIVYTYRIAGNATTVRLPRLSGFVGIAAYDYDGLIVPGWRKMDREQAHWHNIEAEVTSGGTSVLISAAGYSNSGATGVTKTGPVRLAVSDGTNGTPRLGKTTDPRTYGVYTYTWAGSLLA